MTPIDKILPLLQGVRKSTVPNHWMALCPAHADKAPSLSVRLFDDDSIGVKCFAGCGSVAILGALGLDPRDLFPRNRSYGGDSGNPSRNQPKGIPPWREVITFLREDLVAVQIGAARIAAGDELSEADLDRLAIAAARISELLERIK